LLAPAGGRQPWFYGVSYDAHYDGNGGHFGDTLIAASSNAPQQVTTYAATNSTDGTLTNADQ
jgi:hypothetical protein